MTQALLIVGASVFFISVWGAVMVGGYLLGKLEQDEPGPAAMGIDKAVARTIPSVADDSANVVEA